MLRKNSTESNRVLELATDDHLDWTKIKVPMFILTISPKRVDTGRDNSSMISGQHTTVFLSLHQQDMRSADGASMPYLDMGLTILAVQADGSFSLLGAVGTSAERQNQVRNTAKYSRSELFDIFVLDAFES